MAEPKRDPSEQKPKTAWQNKKESWYEKLVNSANLTTRKLDIVIALCVIVLVVSLTIGYINRGYTVNFNSTGGTFVESQEHMYGDLIVVEPPTREGFEFAGWYKDPLFEFEWNLETDKVEGDMTLYASWEEKTE